MNKINSDEPDPNFQDIKAIEEYMDLPKPRPEITRTKKHGSASMDYKPLISYLKPTSSYLNSVTLKGGSRGGSSSTRSQGCESQTCSNR